MSLLREIQNDLARTDGDVVSVLRRCKILAARLGSNEFAQWVDWELNGYPEADAVPSYRRITSSCYASFIGRGWRYDKQPILWAVLPEDVRDKAQDNYERLEFRDGIAKVMAFTKGAHINAPELIPVLQGRMYPQLNCVSAWQEVSNSEFDQLISAVKNRILDFVLKIEAENPAAGEASLNSQPVPPERLQPIVNNFLGHVGNVAQSSRDFSQTASIGIQSLELEKLVKDFTDHLDELNLDSRQRKKAEAQIATLKAQLTDEPDPVIVRQAVRSLRDITVGAIGSLLATGVQPTVWHWIHQMMTTVSN